MQIYDSPESDLKLNDVFEFVGVLMFDSEPATEKDDTDECSNGFCEDALTQLPPSKVLLQFTVTDAMCFIIEPQIYFA